MVGALLLAFAGSGSPVQAQGVPARGAQRASRAELAARLADVEQVASAASTKKDAKQKAAAEVEAIRTRLNDGDFRVGDRFVYTITQDTIRSDTASVRDGFVASVINLPDFSLKGVLRSELTERLQAHVDRYLKHAIVRTNVLTLVQVTGAVGRPGFYTVFPDRPLSEILMTAGGPSVDAKLDELEIKRGDKTVLSGGDSRKAIKEGKTAEQVDLQSGDAVNIPMKRKISWTSILQAFSIVSVLFFSVISFLQWYYSRQE
jgi:hypothetical protein